METALSIVAAYLLGSVSFGILVSRLAGLPDPRSYGSNSPGAGPRAARTRASHF